MVIMDMEEEDLSSRLSLANSSTKAKAVHTETSATTLTVKKSSDSNRHFSSVDIWNSTCTRAS